MEYLHRYSSSDSADEPNLPPATDSKATESLAPLDLPAPPEDLVAYLQDYAMNQLKQYACFLHLPWQPSPASRDRLKAMLGVGLRGLENALPGFKQRFISNNYISGSVVQHGQFGLTNSRANRSLHMSLFPNLRAKSHILRQFETNVVRACRSVPIPAPLQSKAPPSILDLLTLLLSTNAKQLLRLPLDQRFRFMHLKKTGSVFLALEVVDTTALEYLHKLHDVIKREAEQLDIHFNPQQFFAQYEDNGFMRYHVTLLVCELRSGMDRISREEFDTLVDAVAKLDISEYTKGLVFETDGIRIDGGHRKVIALG